MSRQNFTVLTVVPFEEEEIKKDDNLVPVLEKSLVLVHELLQLAQCLKMAIEEKYGPSLEKLLLTEKSATSDCVCFRGRDDRDKDTFHELRKGVTASSSAGEQVAPRRSCNATCPYSEALCQTGTVPLEQQMTQERSVPQVLSQPCPRCPKLEQQAVPQVLPQPCPPCPYKESPKKEEPVETCCDCTVSRKGSKEDDEKAKDEAEEKGSRKSSAADEKGEKRSVKSATGADDADEKRSKKSVVIEEGGAAPGSRSSKTGVADGTPSADAPAEDTPQTEPEAENLTEFVEACEESKKNRNQ